MAFTKTPVNDTYSTERIPGYAPYVLSMTNTVSSMQNLIAVIPDEAEKNSDPICAETRSPIKAVQVDTSTSSNIARGCYVWEKSAGTIYYFAVFGTKIYTSTTGAAGSWTNVTTFTTSATSPVGFTEFIDSSTNTKSFIVVDGVEGYVFTSNAAGTKITDADFPTPHLPYPIYLDGYLVLAKANTGDIYNSDLNTPSAWTAGNFISSELYPDDLTALIKVNNYILAIGKLGCEYFYDAANATGSPFARYEGGSLPFGCPVPSSIASNKDSVIMLCNTSDGLYTLKLIEGFKYKDITPNWLPTYVNIFANGSGAYSLSGIRGYYIRHNNQLCYVFMATTTSTSSGATIAWILSINTNIWSLLTYGDGYWPIVASSFGSSSNVTTYVCGNTKSTPDLGNGGKPVFGTYGLPLSGQQDAMDDLNYTTNTSFQHNIPTVLQTKYYDFGTLNLKTNNRFGIYCEIANSDVSSTNNLGLLTVQTSDVPFSSSGTYRNSRTFPIVPVDSGTPGPFPYYPFVTQLGVFRQRSWKLSYTNTYPIRYKWFEVDINKGQR